MLLSFENIYKYFGDKNVLSSVSATVENNDRIGIIGRNGTGKTTLLNIICKELSFDDGTLNIGRKTSIGYLKQNSGLESDSTIYEEMKKIFSDLIKIREELKILEKQMEELSFEIESEKYKKVSEKFATLSTLFEQREGYNIDVKIKTVLNGMGFAEKDLNTVINTLSGGERTRLALSRLLLLQPDLLVLDEPTNHLDFETIAWLEEYLETYKGAVLTVSHDRYFLDKLVNKIWEIEDNKLCSYKGNYSKFLVLKEEEDARKLKEYELQQKKIADLKDYVAKNLVRASTSKSAKSRINTLERMDIIDKPKTFTKKMPIKFDYDFEPNFEVLCINDLTLSVGDLSDKKVLCSNISLVIERGDKLAVIGANGSGKTTFLKQIKNYPSDNKCIRWGGNVKIGYYDQHLSVLNPQNTVMEELWARFPKRDPLSIRTTLGRALFSGENIEKRVCDLSGGEKARLSLAILMEERPNILIMDEPTNHLDLSVREMLEKALLDFEGTLILVSHDRYFLEKIPNKILYLNGENSLFFNGNYGEFFEKYKTGNTEEIHIEKREKPDNIIKNTNYRSKKQRALDSQRRVQIASLEKELNLLENRIKEMEELLGNPDIYSDFEKSAELCKELENTKKQYDEKMEQWILFLEDLEG